MWPRIDADERGSGRMNGPCGRRSTRIRKKESIQKLTFFIRVHPRKSAALFLLDHPRSSSSIRGPFSPRLDLEDLGRFLVGRLIHLRLEALGQGLDLLLARLPL